MDGHSSLLWFNRTMMWCDVMWCYVMWWWLTAPINQFNSIQAWLIDWQKDWYRYLPTKFVHRILRFVCSSKRKKKEGEKKEGWETQTGRETERGKEGRSQAIVLIETRKEWDRRLSCIKEGKMEGMRRLFCINEGTKWRNEMIVCLVSMACIWYRLGLQGKQTWSFIEYLHISIQHRSFVNEQTNKACIINCKSTERDPIAQLSNRTYSLAWLIAV
jgi:hypothetical protein